MQVQKWYDLNGNEIPPPPAPEWTFTPPPPAPTRDEIAMRVLVAILSNPTTPPTVAQADAARKAYEIADALMLARTAPAYSPAAPPPPAPAQAGWTDAQLDAAWDFHLRTRGYTIDIRASREMICGQLAEIAPLFAPKVRVKLPERLPIEPGMRPETFERRTTYNQAIDACAAAIRAAGAAIEGEPAS